MNRKFIPIALLAFGISVFGVSQAEAFEFHLDEFDLTMVVDDVILVPAPYGSTDGSYYLVKGTDADGKTQTIEIQVNALSLAFNLDEGFDGELNRDVILSEARQNIGNEVKFTCNGALGLEFMEEYAQCFKMEVTEVLVTPPEAVALECGSASEIEFLKKQISEKDALLQEQLKVISQLAGM